MHFRAGGINRVLFSLLAVVVASLLLFFGSLSVSNVVPVQAQVPVTPTPQSMSELDRDFGDLILQPHEERFDPPKYAGMDSNLNLIVEQFESGQFTARMAATGAPLHSEESVAVTIYIFEGYAEAIVAYLETNGASPRNVDSCTASTAMIPYGPSGTGSDPRVNWPRCPQMDFDPFPPCRSVPGVAHKVSEASVS